MSDSGNGTTPRYSIQCWRDGEWHDTMDSLDRSDAERYMVIFEVLIVDARLMITDDDGNKVEVV